MLLHCLLPCICVVSSQALIAYWNSQITTFLFYFEIGHLISLKEAT